jgi:sugar transferase EpsL
MNMRTHRKIGLYQRFFKRAIDITASLAGLIILSPLLLWVAVMVRIKLGSPVLFRQRRAGYKGLPFEILKFRTMTDERDARGELLPDEVRLKPFGIFLRRYSLDEFPQFINVLRGDLSLIGPRPLLMQYLELYTPEQARRHDVKPGVTGLAQVNGRNAIAWEEKFRWDVKYVDELSLALDVQILFKTAMRVLRPQGISAPGHATATMFTGSPPAAKPASAYPLPDLLRSLLITESDWNSVPRTVQAAIVLMVERNQALERRAALAEASMVTATPVIALPRVVMTPGSDFEDEPITQSVEVPLHPILEDETAAVTHSNREEAFASLRRAGAKPQVSGIDEMSDVTREVRFTAEEISRILEEETVGSMGDDARAPVRIRK